MGKEFRSLKKEKYIIFLIILIMYKSYLLFRHNNSNVFHFIFSYYTFVLP